jgi:hypothetical protein
MISLHAIFYGDHPELAARLLSLWEFVDWSCVRDVRLGLNETSARTNEVLARLANFPVPTYFYVPERNVGKYPLWRRLFVGLDDADYVMYFDDDVLGLKDPSAFKALFAQILGDDADAFGYPNVIDFQGRQADGFAAQPWYAGKPWYYDHRPGRRRHRIWFYPGRFLVLRVGFARKWDFPFPELHHNGGDTALGECLRQQDAVTYQRPTLGDLKLSSIVDYGDSPRRGISQPRLWYDWPAPPASGLHDFTCEILPYVDFRAAYGREIAT